MAHVLLTIVTKESWILGRIRIRVDGQDRFESGYVWMGKFDLNRDTCGWANSIWIGIRVDGQIRFESGYEWAWTFFNRQRTSCGFKNIRIRVAKQGNQRGQLTKKEVKLTTTKKETKREINKRKHLRIYLFFQALHFKQTIYYNQG